AITITAPAASAGSTHLLIPEWASSRADATSAPRYTITSCPGWYALPAIGAQVIDKRLHAASRNSPPAAIQNGRLSRGGHGSDSSVWLAQAAWTSASIRRRNTSAENRAAFPVHAC